MPGFYLHVPFCARKCPYCDFYSRPAGPALMDGYTDRAIAAMAPWAGLSVDTVYFGGGTPSLLGAERLGRLLGAIKERFSLSPGAEVTLEANPAGIEEDFFPQLRRAGFNRLSLGLQSSDPAELRFLGRAHSPQDAARAVGLAQKAGFSNISLDLMLGLPGGTKEKLGRSIAFAAGLSAAHISAYILKVEPGTPFSEQGVSLPDDDETAGQYLFAVEELARRGFPQYEISNFARPGFESRHNLVYWQGKEYLGIGPGAHSFLGGRRFYFPRDLEGFLQGAAPLDDGPGGSIEEFAMLNLRLARGLLLSDCEGKFGPAGAAAFSRIQQNARACPPHLLRQEPERLSFTPEGFLVSNALLVKVLEGL